MPILPSTTPIQYEYKPLNLMAFAAPLSEMQKQLDLTKELVETPEFDIANLPYGTDPEKAKELKQLVESKRNEIATSLATSKNYQQAARQIKSLNNLWQKDPHKLALESNAKVFAARDAEELKRLADGKISKSDYEQWKRDEVRKYEELGGASFFADAAKPEGKYNIVTGKVGRLENLEDELQELSWKVAGAVGTNKREGALREIDIDPETMDKRFQKIIIEERDPKVVAKAVHDYLLTQPKYTEWGKESAYYNLRDMMASPNAKQYAEGILQGATRDNATKLKLREEQLKRAKGNKDEDPIYQQLLENQQEYSQMQQTGEYDFNTLKSAYQQQYLNNMFDMSALGKVYAKKDVSYEDVFRDIPTTGKGGTGAGGDILGADAFFNPEVDTEFTIPGFQTQATKAASTLYGTAKTLLNYGKGNVRVAVFNGLSEKEKAELNNNPAALVAKSRNLLTAYSNSNNVGEFIKNAKDKGIDLTTANASTIYKLWSSPDKTGINQFKQSLESVSTAENAYNSAKENIEIIKNQIRNSDDWKNTMEFLNNAAPTPKQTVIQGGDVVVDYKWTPTTAKLFNPNSYTDEQLKKAGIDVNLKAKKNDDISGGFQTVLSFGEVAKLRGYKNVEDAVKKGYDFGGAYVNAASGLTVSTVNKNIEDKLGPQLNTQAMAQNLLNTPGVSKSLRQMTTTIEELKQHAPAYKTSFNNLPGFDEEGNTLPGTKLITDAAHTPVLQMHGNNVYYKYYYQYMPEDGKTPVITSLTVKPKAGNDPKTLQFLDAALVTAKGEDAASKQAKAGLLEAKFNATYDNNISMSTFEAIPVNKSGQKRDIESIPGVSPGQKIVFTKEWDNSYMNPVIRLYVENAAGKRAIINSDGTIGGAGKGFTTDSPSEAKRFIGSMLLDVDVQETK